MTHTHTHTPLDFRSQVQGCKSSSIRVGTIWTLTKISVTHNRNTYNHKHTQQQRYFQPLIWCIDFLLLCDWTIMGISVCVLHDPHQGTRATPILNQSISHGCLHADCTVSTATQAVLSKEKCLVWCEWRSERVMWGQWGVLIHKNNAMIWCVN